MACADRNLSCVKSNCLSDERRGVMHVISDLQIRENEEIPGPPVLYAGGAGVLRTSKASGNLQGRAY